MFLVYVGLLTLVIHIHGLLRELQEFLNGLKIWLPLFA